MWVLDSNQLGFNRAEQYHQFHNGLGTAMYCHSAVLPIVLPGLPAVGGLPAWHVMRACCAGQAGQHNRTVAWVWMRCSQLLRLITSSRERRAGRLQPTLEALLRTEPPSSRLMPATHWSHSLQASGSLSPLPSALYSLAAGKSFPKSYTEDLKRQMAQAGTIGETGCPEFFYF